MSDYLAANPGAIPGAVPGGLPGLAQGTGVRLGEGGRDQEFAPLALGRGQAGAINVTQHNTFVGGDVPTTTQMDAINRKLGIMIGLEGRR